MLDFSVDAVLKVKINGEEMRVVLIGEVDFGDGVVRAAPITFTGPKVFVRGRMLVTLERHLRFEYRLDTGSCLNQRSIL